MTHVNPQHPAPASFIAKPRQPAREPSPPSVPRGGAIVEQEGLFSSLPRHVTRSNTQPPAWWLDERAKVLAAVGTTA